MCAPCEVLRRSTEFTAPDRELAASTASTMPLAGRRFPMRIVRSAQIAQGCRRRLRRRPMKTPESSTETARQITCSTAGRRPILAPVATVRYKDTSLPGFMMPSGSSACLIARSAWMRPGGARRANSATLQLADAVLGRNRAAGGGHEVVDEARDLLAFALVPVGRGMAAGADVEVDVAVAEMPEAARDHAGECALDLGRGLDDERAACRRPAPKCRARASGLRRARLPKCCRGASRRPRPAPRWRRAPHRR